MKKLLSLLFMLTLILFPSIASAFPASAATTLPTLDLKYVYNCLNPTVEITISNLGGTKDIYFQDDAGIILIAGNYNFDANKVYDGFYSFGSVQQVDVYATNVGSGPYADRVIEKSVAATSLCPTYYPVYDAHSVAPTTPVGSVNVHYAYLQWFQKD
jgi:hypothetical protein